MCQVRPISTKKTVTAALPLCLNRALKQKWGFKDPFCLLACRYKQITLLNQGYEMNNLQNRPLSSMKLGPVTYLTLRLLQLTAEGGKYCRFAPCGSRSLRILGRKNSHGLYQNCQKESRDGSLDKPVLKQTGHYTLTLLHIIELQQKTFAYQFSLART